MSFDKESSPKILFYFLYIFYFFFIFLFLFLFFFFGGGGGGGGGRECRVDEGGFQTEKNPSNSQ